VVARIDLERPVVVRDQQHVEAHALVRRAAPGDLTGGGDRALGRPAGRLRRDVRAPRGGEAGRAQRHGLLDPPAEPAISAPCGLVRIDRVATARSDEQREPDESRHASIVTNTSSTRNCPSWYYWITTWLIGCTFSPAGYP